MLVTIFGSCRQDAIYNLPGINVTGIRDNISYTHYTKEILEVIKFCKQSHVSPEETLTIFRTPILKNKQLYYNNVLKNNFNNTELFILEIASKKTYLYNNNYVHHILFTHDNYNKNYKDKIKVSILSDEEIEDDIIKIKNELNNRTMIVVGHIVTHNFGNRYKLLTLLENICAKHNIYFINPVKELVKLGHNVKNLLTEDGTHYNMNGHSAIKDVYSNFIK